MSDTISVFLRMRPTKSASYVYTLVPTGVEFAVPKEENGYINNTKERYDFQFNQTFSPDATQQDVFDAVARPTLMSAMDGYNGTIFAYGQTGSGKTFTITGGAERYADRGIIPRSLSMLFQEFKSRSDYTFQMHVSYLEIYNDIGYDLLSPKSEHTRALEDLPRVFLQEDEDGNIHLGNLSAHLCMTEEDALNALFLGDMNRMVSETPMNPVSSRSHCIFTIYITATRPGSDIIRKSKVHLVDLAGSERVHKTGYGSDDGRKKMIERGKQASTGQLIREAKAINVSLHYLEMVIMALQEKSKGKPVSHIPYRNSMMTSVLRDSLGGNCRTSMVANISPDVIHLEESMSTCRFAQRVACVSNSAKANEEVDPRLVIKRLRQEVIDLKEQIALLQGGEENEPLDAERMTRLRELVISFVDDPSPDAVLNVGPSMSKMKACFSILKNLLREERKAPKASSSGGGASSEELQKLQLQLMQRDNEINILVNMLKKEGATAGDLMASTGSSMFSMGSTATGAQNSRSLGGTMPASLPSSSSSSISNNGAGRGGGGGGGAAAAAEPPPTGAAMYSSAVADAETLKDRNKAFESFRKSYRKNEIIEDNKKVLKEKYTQAQTLGEEVKRSRTLINDLKAHIEQLRTERAMQNLSSGSEMETDPEEEAAMAKIDAEKANYKEKYDRLRSLKPEIEHLQMMLEKSRVQLQKDFEQWFVIMARQQGLPVADNNNDPRQQQQQQKAMTLPRANIGGPGDNNVPATGNSEADAEIAAFYRARQELLARRGGGA